MEKKIIRESPKGLSFLSPETIDGGLGEWDTKLINKRSKNNKNNGTK
jgi:hypothetical protein